MRYAHLAVVAAVAAAACLEEPPPAPPLTQSDVADGRQLAEVHCSACHAIGAAGESGHPDAPPFRTLSRDYPVTALEEAFAEGILVGHPDMPEFRLEPPQIDALIAYIQSVQEEPAG